MRLLKTIIPLIFIVLTHMSYGAVEPVNVRLQANNIAVGADLIVLDNKLWQIEAGNWQNNFSIQSVQNKIVFGIDESDISFNQTISYSYKVIGNLSYKQLENGQLVEHIVDGIELIVDYNPAGHTTYTDRNVFSFSGGLEVKFRITEYEYSTDGIAWVAVSNYPSFVYLESEISTERYYPFSQLELPLQAMQMNITNGKLKVNWSYVTGAEEYELEWAWVSRYSGEQSSGIPVLLPATEVKFNFSENATRVRTRGQNTYSIPLIYGDGYIVLRYRGIGRGGNNFRIPLEGKWNYSVNDGFIVNSPNYIAVSSHEGNNINYGAGVSFIENGVKSVGITYMDGVLKPRQSQSKLNSQDKIIVGSTIYDYYGRPAIGVMSTPVNQSFLGYVDNLNMHADGTVYNKSHFDFDNTATGCGAFDTAPPMNATLSAGAAKYYSDENPDKGGFNAYLPDAEGYPFVQVKYDDNPTGRIKKVGGIGPDHQLGDVVVNTVGKEKHYTQYYYTIPDSLEMYKLFGNEGIDASNYTKIITKDVHGQLSVAITDPMGRTVATYMLGDSPSGLETIEGNIYPSASNVGKNFMSYNNVNDINGVLEVNTPIVVEKENQSYIFNYDFTGVNFSSCLPINICFDCAYTIKIRISADASEYQHSCPILDASGSIISDVNGVVEFEYEVGTLDAADFNIDCDTYTFSGGNPGSETFTVVFPKMGKYTIIKELVVSEAPIDYYWEQYIANDTCLLTYNDFLETTLAGVDFSSCDEYEPCEFNFLLEHGTLEIYLLSNDPDGLNTAAITVEYNHLRESFIDNCGTQNPCESMYPSMLLDFKMGGQYANGTTSISIFGSPGSSSLYPTGQTFSSYLPDFDANGNPILIDTDLDGTPDTPPSSATQHQFEDDYQNEWAEYFLVLHPEYCYYEFCDLNQDLYTFENTLNSTSTYAEACALNLLSLYSLYTGGCGVSGTASDPIFALFATASQAAQTEMQAIMSTSYNGNTIFEYSSILAGNLASEFGTASCNDDAHWLSFKSLYLSLRFQLIDILKEEYALGNCPNANCVGNVDESSCANNPFVNSIPRYIDFQTGLGFDLNSTPDWPAIGNNISANIDQVCIDQCTGMANTWMANLSGCVNLTNGQLWAPGNTLFDQVKAALINTCSGGCGAEWPFLAQSNPNYEPQANPIEYESFQSVIETLLGVETAECSHLLIFNPAPNAGSESLIQYLDECGCNTLLSTGTTPDEAAFEALYGFIPVNYQSEHCKCLKYDSGGNNNGIIDGGEIDHLLTDAIFTPNTYPCNAECIDCKTIKIYMNDFLSEFQVDYLEAPMLFTSYVNSITNGSYDFNQLVEFIENCALINSGQTVPNQNAYDFLELLQALNEDDLTTSQTYNHTTLPELFYSGLYNESICGAISAANFHYELLYTGDGKIYFNLYDDLCNPCTFIITIGTNNTYLAGYTSRELFLQNIVSFDGVRWVAASGLNVSFDITVSNPNGIGTTSGVFRLAHKGCYTISYESEGFKICSDDYEPEPLDDCMDDLIENAEISAQEQFDGYIEDQEAIFRKDYISACTNITDEVFTTNYESNRYQYTLLYYDQSGSLVKTVPPKGVLGNMLSDAQAELAKNGNVVTPPAYTYKTTYKHNSLNQVVSVNTPDGGTSNYWYDAIGRLVVSQNSKQATFTTGNITGNYDNGAIIPAYSFTKYDNLGRVIEVGEVIQPTQMTKAIAKDPILLANWLSSTSNVTKNNITQIYYDDAFSSVAEAEFGSEGHGYTRNRITATSVIEGYVTPTSGQWSYPVADYTNHYKYDIHGNVKSYLQEILDLKDYDNLFRRVDYEYDLISGNPNYIYYQKGKADQYIHHYIYDKDNRLKEVFTSNDNQTWDRDVNYEYREDGYLARTELGEMKVQGLDYAYTLHGWLKSLNSGVLNADFDMGKDGKTNPTNEYSTVEADIHGLVAQDALAYTIGYYDGDYTAISTGMSGFGNMQLETSSSLFSTDRQDLFNGNITSLVTSLTDLDGNKLNVHANTYHYDQLHRFKEMHVFSDDNITSNNNLSTAIRSNVASGLGDYEVNLNYDMNGNITDLRRRAFTHQNDPLTSDDDNDIFHDNKMDKFSYDYSIVNADGTPTNKLKFVDDGITTTGNLGYGDIQNGQNGQNYTYHPNGSLKSDADEGIKYMDWYPSGKIKYIKRNSLTHPLLSDMYFEYGPMGIRSKKVEITKDGSGNILPITEWNTTYYATDANGITLAIYSFTITDVNNSSMTELHKIESMIYGGSRLGMGTTKVDVRVTEDPLTACQNDGLAMAVIKITNALATGYSIAISADGLPINTGTTYTNDYQTSVELAYDIAKNNPTLVAYNSSVNIGGQYVLCVILKETVAGELGGIVNMTLGGSGNDFTATHLVRQPSIGNCYSERVLGKKMYELSNHLGNVMEVITDRKVGIDDGTYDNNGNLTSTTLDNIVDYYVADIVSFSDYYPFGMQMPGRNGTVSGGEYRYAFNGMETDKEVSGEGNSYDFGARMYNPRLGRWFKPDLLEGKYPFSSPYVFVLNKPIVAIDPDGNDIIVVVVSERIYTNSYGEKVFERTISVDIKISVLNMSSKPIDIVQYKNMVSAKIKLAFSNHISESVTQKYIYTQNGGGNVEKVKLVTKVESVNSEIRVINNYSEIKNNDHVIVLVDEHLYNADAGFVPGGLNGGSYMTVNNLNGLTKYIIHTTIHELET